jgi:voltage-gated potassium channel
LTNQARNRPDFTDESVTGQHAPTEAQSGASSRTGRGPLTRRQRRRVVTITLVRTALSVTVLVWIYFNIPLRGVTEGAPALFLTAGLIGVAVVLGFQIRATIRSVHPGLRAVESLGTSVPLILLLFSVVHYLVDRASPESYTEPLNRLDALYFSVTMFATVGFGDISPVSQVARVITMLQMLANLAFLAVVARVLFGAALDNRRPLVGHYPGGSGGVHPEINTGQGR